MRLFLIKKEKQMGRNLFDLDNARNLHTKELVDTFIVTKAFEDLLSPKNQIIIGSRGSGKTALLKMISHSHLSLFNNDLAKEIIDNKTYIGIHISTKTKFSGGLKNKNNQSEEEREEHFKWLMNVASCMALLETLKSCLSKYISDTKDRVSKEIEIVNKLKDYWFAESSDNLFTIDDVAQKIDDIVIARQQNDLLLKINNNNSPNTVGLSFAMELFEPLYAAIKMINRKLSFPNDTSWFVCIDEIEILDTLHHRILNSYMRSHQDNIYFKFTTLPYCHYTLETNLKVQLDVRHDVHYIYIDQDASFFYRAEEDRCNALKLFRKRADYSRPEYAKYNFKQIFGKSQLLDTRIINYDEFTSSPKKRLSEKEVIDIMSNNDVLSLFLKHSNDKTKTKGIELLRDKKIKDFGDQFGRKMRSLLFLKETISSIRGNQNVEVYCGAKTVINVGDGNPRKLITIFKEMLLTLDEPKNESYFTKQERLIPYSSQNMILATIAEREHNRYRQEINLGTKLYRFIDMIGSYMNDYIHKNKINTEQLSSIEFNQNNDDDTWELVERAVQKGLLYPNINIHNPDDMPYKEGIFHLAFILSPKFKLLPRKGDSRNISTIMGSQQLKLEFDA